MYKKIKLYFKINQTKNNVCVEKTIESRNKNYEDRIVLEKKNNEQ